MAESQKKVSEIFLRYVAPLMDGAPKDVEPEYLQKVLTFPTMIWNAVVMKDWGKSSNYIQMILDQLSKSGAPQESTTLGEPMVRLWVERKQEMYPEEKWGIQEVVVYRDFNKELMVRVIARAPEKFMNQLPNPKFVHDHRTALN